jgi:hypothetical protein
MVSPGALTNEVEFVTNAVFIVVMTETRGFVVGTRLMPPLAVTRMLAKLKFVSVHCATADDDADPQRTANNAAPFNETRRNHI